MSNIGVLREGPLHAAVKALLARPGDRFEVPVGRFVIDVVRAAREADVACVLKQDVDGSFRVSTRSRGATDVGAACAANRIAIAVPCHRVVKSDGSISGYRWGVQRKRRLLNMEGVA